MEKYACGIDIGSMSTEAVLVAGDGQLIAWLEVPTQPNHRETASGVFQQLLETAGVQVAQVNMVVGTGYGRRNISFASRRITEISCHARGAVACFPEVRMLIDIGGQDSKVIHVDAAGRVLDFAMNDKCAAGTGKFLNVMAQTLRLDLSALGSCSLQADQGAEISSICTVFAESEVISLIAAGSTVSEIALGVHQAMARRVVSMVKQLGLKTPLAFTGGVARNPGMVKSLEEGLAVELMVPEVPQIIGAYGAALLGLEMIS